MPDLTEVHLTWTSFKGHVLDLTCPINGTFVFRCPPILEDDSDPVISGELFVGTNFTATSLHGNLTGNVTPVQIQLGYGTNPISGDAFPLFPNVHSRATLAMTYIQSIKNTKSAALGLQKVGHNPSNIFQRR